MNKKYSRREFVKQNSLIGLGALMSFDINSSYIGSLGDSEDRHSNINRIHNEVILQGRLNNQSWFAPSVGVIPGDKNRLPEVFISVLLLTGNDIGPQFYLKTNDLGQTWTNPMLCQNCFKIPLKDHVFEEPWFGFFHHSMTNKFFAIGTTHFVQDSGTATGHKNERHFRSPEHRGSIIYSLWDPLREDFEPWVKMRLPKDLLLSVFWNGQFHEEKDGTILFPGFYNGPFNRTGGPSARGVTVLRCIFNGHKLRFVEHGSVHVVQEARGLAEPSIMFFKGRYYMTIRHDLRAYVTMGDDGLHYEELKTWCFDSGEDLGNYNTMQKWLKHNDTFYLVYNRRSELNKGVFRSRAPLFMAEVDPERLVVLRDTERIVFPEKGARMGNFHSANITDKESWIITGEWLQGIFDKSKKGDRFWFDRDTYNYIQYIGDLLLARIH